MIQFTILLLALLALGGCAGIFKELKDDPAIITTTGFWLSLGLNPAPEVGGIPLPSLKLGYGTIARIGGDRDVTVTVGATGEVKAGQTGLSTAASQAIPTLSGMSSLHITAKNRTKMNEVDVSPNDKDGTSKLPKEALNK